MDVEGSFCKTFYQIQVSICFKHLSKDQCNGADTRGYKATFTCEDRGLQGNFRVFLEIHEVAYVRTEFQSQVLEVITVGINHHARSTPFGREPILDTFRYNSVNLKLIELNVCTWLDNVRISPCSKIQVNWLSYNNKSSK